MPSRDHFRALEVCRLVGISYRQLDYWARTGVVRPSVQRSSGSGSQRLYSLDDVVLLRVVKRMLDVGLSLPKIRQALRLLRLAGESVGRVIVTDGHGVYEADEETVLGLLRGGMFAISVDAVRLGLEGELAADRPRRELAVV